MATLKLTLLVHVNDSTAWTPENQDRHQDSLAKRIGLLSTVVGPAGDGQARGARISVQFDRPYLDQNLTSGYQPPTSLGAVFLNGGNFWCHTQSASMQHLQSTFRCVASASAAEMGTTYAWGQSHAAGRSGGPDPNRTDINWATLSIAAGIRRMNDSSLAHYSTLPESLRPFGATGRDLKKGVYRQAAAPGPLCPGVPTTMRQRPFWMNVSSVWDAHIGCIYPSTQIAADIGSILMIPNVGGVPLNEYGSGNSCQDQPISMDHLNVALTEIWTTWQYMSSYQNSITNVWYVRIPAQLIQEDTIGSFGAWVDSVNELMAVNGDPPLACWMNMNEIASVFCDPNSFNY